MPDNNQNAFDRHSQLSQKDDLRPSLLHALKSLQQFTYDHLTILLISFPHSVQKKPVLYAFVRINTHHNTQVPICVNSLIFCLI